MNSTIQGMLDALPGIITDETAQLVKGSSPQVQAIATAVATIASGAALTAYNTALLGSATDPWIKFHSGPIDSSNMCEITILSRHV